MARKKKRNRPVVEFAKEVLQEKYPPQADTDPTRRALDEFYDWWVRLPAQVRAGLASWVVESAGVRAAEDEALAKAYASRGMMRRAAVVAALAEGHCALEALFTKLGNAADDAFVARMRAHGMVDDVPKYGPPGVTWRSVTVEQSDPAQIIMRKATK